jgi:hypothetical protein
MAQSQNDSRGEEARHPVTFEGNATILRQASGICPHASYPALMPHIRQGVLL